MDSNKRLKITTPKQFEKLVNFMVENPNMAKGYHKPTERANIKEQWNTLGKMLNCIGPPCRTTEGWMKVWADMKTSVKKKLVHNSVENRDACAGPFRQKVLTALDETVARLLQMESVLHPEGLSFGVQNSTFNLYEEMLGEDIKTDVSVDAKSEASVDLENEVSLDINSEDCGQVVYVDNLSNVQCRKTQKQFKALEKESLLQQQLKVQTDLYNDVKRSLSEIERYNRKTIQFQEEQLKIKNEKLLMYKQELKKRDMHRSAMLKLKMEEIDLKKRKIAIEESIIV